MTTKKNATKDLAAVVSDAERVAGEAEQLIAALEEKVKAGDESVSPEQVEAARGVSRFATQRMEGARRMAERARVDDGSDYDHTYTPSGLFIKLGVMQDALEVPCVVCGKRTGGESWAHKWGCPEYRPHPSSIAGIAAQSDGAMLPGDSSEPPQGPEDALGDGPKFGDYRDRIGDSTYQPHSGAEPQRPNTEGA